MKYIIDTAISSFKIEKLLSYWRYLELQPRPYLHISTYHKFCSAVVNFISLFYKHQITFSSVDLFNPPTLRNSFPSLRIL